jgi:transposase-like protein
MSKLKDIEGLFNGRHFDREVIVLCVRWYLRYELSFRGIAEMMAERGLSLAHTTIMRWVKRFTPEFAKRWNRLAVTAGQSWRVDETYVKIRGKWAYDGAISGSAPGATLPRARPSSRRRSSAARSRIDHAGRLRSVSPRGTRDEG